MRFFSGKKILPLLALLPNAAFAGYYNAAFLQVDSGNNVQVTTYDNNASQRVFIPSLGSYKAVGLDQSPTDGQLYILGTQVVNLVRQCQVFTLNLITGATAAPFPSFTCNSGNPRDIEATEGGEHSIPMGSTLMHYNPLTKAYEVYTFIYAAGDSGNVTGQPPEIIATAEPPGGLTLNGVKAVSIGLEASRGMAYLDTNGPYAARGYTVQWDPASDINTTLKQISVHTVGTPFDGTLDAQEATGASNISDTTGTVNPTTRLISNSSVLEQAVSLDEDQYGNLHLFWIGAPYSNPFGFGQPSSAADTFCLGNQVNGDLSSGNTSFNKSHSADNSGTPRSQPAFMSSCEHPSTSGLANVVALAELNKSTFSTGGSGSGSSSGGGAFELLSVLVLALLGMGRRMFNNNYNCSPI